MPELSKGLLVCLGANGGGTGGAVLEPPSCGLGDSESTGGLGWVSVSEDSGVLSKGSTGALGGWIAGGDGGSSG